MHDELVKSLRELCEMTALCDDYSCFECPYEEECGSYKNGRLSAVYRQAADAIEKLSKPRWISVTEALPEAGERVLCYCRANIYEVMKMRTDGAWVHNDKVYDSAYMSGFVTHWMPLPQPPEEGRA